MSQNNFYFSKTKTTMVSINRWDLLAFFLIIGILIAVALGAKQMTVPYHFGETIPIHLQPDYLPMYGLRTVLRMFFALFLSLSFTFIFGTLAAKNKHAERLIIPMIDILQSVPILGFMSMTVTIFIHLFQGSLLGPECASIFVIFTSQAWNMTLSFYQSLRTLPGDLIEASNMFRLSAWQRFWRVEVPFAMPGLLWNTMMSMSASWFFVVASEAITAAHQDITLPGIGSYIAKAIAEANISAVLYAILAMFIVILLYDQIIFRPLVRWAEKFKLDAIPQESFGENWLIKILQRTYLLKYFYHAFDYIVDFFVNITLFRHSKKNNGSKHVKLSLYLVYLWYSFLLIALLFATVRILTFIFLHIPLHEVGYVVALGFFTALRVFAVVIFCTLVWVPLGVAIGLRPKIARIAQPMMQFLAAFPAYLLFPVFVILIVKFHLNVQIWVTPLLILGTQWYVAFNVIAGATAIPKDLHLAVKNFHVKRFLKWRRFLFPGIFPYYVTGAITAVGGAWNTSIVAEVVSWGTINLKATGLGAYIAEYSSASDYPRLILGISIMCLFVLLLNRVIWRPLYHYAERKFRLE